MHEDWSHWCTSIQDAREYLGDTALGIGWNVFQSGSVILIELYPNSSVQLFSWSEDPRPRLKALLELPEKTLS